MSTPKVFISFSHGSDSHREKVFAPSERLRDDRIETLLDRYVNGSSVQGRPRWMLDQLDAADFVLIVCTETYYRRFRGHGEPGIRTWLWALTGALTSEQADPDSAQSDLHEAREIAERGPMKLFLADIHLHRAATSSARSSIFGPAREPISPPHAS